MAVLPGIPGLSVCVTVDGNVATEYADPDGEQGTTTPGMPTTSCYIESKTGAPFCFQVKVDSACQYLSQRDSLLYTYIIDGVSRGKTCDSQISVPYSTTLKGIWTPAKGPSEKYGKTAWSNFQFGNITIVNEHDRDRVNYDTDIANGLGTLKLVVVAGVFQSRTPRQHYTPFLGEMENKFELAEKALKGRALSHGTLATKVKECPAPDGIQISNSVTIGSFQFKYRSLESLKQELIIPRSPSPMTTGPLSNLSQGEIERLAMERLQEREEEPKTLKRESDNGPSMTHIPVKIIKLPDGRDAVDLTGDSEEDS